MVNYSPLRFINALLLIISFNSWSATDSTLTLDNELGRNIFSIYNQLAKSPVSQENIKHTYRQAEKNYQDGKYAASLQILATNQAIDIIHNNDSYFQPTIRLALKLYCTLQVEKLLQSAKKNGDNVSEAKLSFELARFYAENEEWSKIPVLLKDEALFEQLTKADLTEAYILLGTALQKNKKHREAIKIYEKIPENSDHFRVAQLNLATAYLRQDWWTDAHHAITSALKTNAHKRDDLDYRLFTMLGYSKIQFGFYRDARESFRNVAISSSYAQHALLGLGLAALHQQDFIGALNAFDKLRTQSKYDISIAESYLLSAFTLKKLQQINDAMNRYNEAINYYQNISNDISKQQQSITISTLKFLRPENRKNTALFNNSRKIILLEQLIDSNYAADKNKIIDMKRKYDEKSLEEINILLSAEKKEIDSYLSQARFGLASLYDQK